VEHDEDFTDVRGTPRRVSSGGASLDQRADGLGINRLTAREKVVERDAVDVARVTVDGSEKASGVLPFSRRC
jgi:hypothetical protein